MAKNYLYNGMKLPALPDIDANEYPYLTIVFGIPTALHATKQPSTIKCFTSDSGEIFPWSVEIGEGLEFTLPLGNDPEKKWNEPTTISSVSVIFLDTWANHDVIGDKDGVVYVAASAPVPVVEAYTSYIHNGTWRKGTFYKRLHGAWIKHQAYKRQNGAWVKVKE